MMRRIWVGLGLLLVVVPFGYCQESKQPLQLTIKADKEVYGVGEEIVIDAEIMNLLDKAINVDKYLDWNHAARFLWENEKKEECQLVYVGPIDIMVPTDLPPQKSFRIWSYQIVWLENNEFKWGSFKFELIKGKGYSLPGKQTIAMKGWGLTSNTITIKVVEKKAVSKEEALKIAAKVCEESGWKWVDVSVVEDTDTWRIASNSHAQGGNAVIVLDKKTGAVLDKRFVAK